MVSCYCPGDCTVHCPPRHRAILNGMSCMLAKSGAMLPALLFTSSLAMLSSSAGPCWQPGWDSVQSQDTFRCPQRRDYMCSSSLKLSVWPEKIWLGQSWAVREGSGHTKIDTPVGIHHSNKGAVFAQCSPGFPLVRRILCRSCAMPASLIWQRSGCLAGCFWATECLTPWQA